MSALVALAYIARALAHGGESTWWREHGREGAAARRAKGAADAGQCSSAVAAARAATLVARCKGLGALWQSVVECEYAWGEGGEESRARGTQWGREAGGPHVPKGAALE